MMRAVLKYGLFPVIPNYPMRAGKWRLTRSPIKGVGKIRPWGKSGLRFDIELTLHLGGTIRTSMLIFHLKTQAYP